MKFLRIIVALLSMAFLSIQAYSQQVPVFKSLRYDEEYSVFKRDSSTDWYKKTKHASLSQKGSAYISFGGEIRYQYFDIKNENWGESEEDKDGFMLSRFLVHADFHASPHFRTFIQLQSSLANGKLNTSPLDENPLELHQAFLDIDLKPSSKSRLLFRVGRQEMLYGSQRLVAVRDGPNNRQSFDAVKAIFTTANYQIDLFLSRYVKAMKGLFNDGFNKDSKFWGAYITSNKFPILQHVDLYYLGLWKRNSIFDDGTGEETRHSFGSRIWNNKAAIKYDIEGLYQFGKFAGKDISAWTLSLNLGHRFNNQKMKPEIGLKTELISGDAGYGDKRLQTFNPLFPRGGYFGLASLIGPANIFDIHPSFSLELKKTLLFNIDYDIFWRHSLNDGIYTPGVSLIYSGKDNPYRFIGNQLAFDLVYVPNIFLYFRAEFTWFNAGDFLKAAGPGKDILFSGITGQLRF